MSNFAEHCLYIISDCDAPAPQMVCIIDDGTWQYIDSAKEGKWRKSHPLYSMALVTPLERFGVKASYDHETGMLTVDPVGASTATYPDGEPRKWQSAKRSIIVREAVRARVAAIFDFAGKVPV